MKASAIAIGLIKQVEGLSLKPYPDGAGYMTVGYGHMLREDETPSLITREQAESYFQLDLALAEDTVNRLVDVELTQNQFDALVSFVYNIGEEQFFGSGLLRELNNERYEEVPRRLMMWNKHKVNDVLKPSKGLTNRRKKEVALWNGTD